MLTFDAVYCYGLPEYRRIIALFEVHGRSRLDFPPHGGHLFGLQVAAGLGFGGCACDPDGFQPIGGFSPGAAVVDRRTAPPGCTGDRLRDAVRLDGSVSQDLGCLADGRVWGHDLLVGTTTVRGAFVRGHCHVERLDHVHVVVRDREVSADLRGRVLCLERAQDIASWAVDPMGPLFPRSRDRHNCLALFARPVDRRDGVDRTVAFGVDGRGFVAFFRRLRTVPVFGRAPDPLTERDVIDHGLAWSLYFTDPDGNRA